MAFLLKNKEKKLVLIYMFQQRKLDWHSEIHLIFFIIIYQSFLHCVFVCVCV